MVDDRLKFSTLLVSQACLIMHKHLFSVSYCFALKDLLAVTQSTDLVAHACMTPHQQIKGNVM